jgi:hypothetical protein
VVAATLFNVKIVLLQAEWSIIQRSKTKEKGCWLATECIFLPQHLGAQEPGGSRAQILTKPELGKRSLPVLPLINQTSDDLATLVLARDTHGSFFGVVSRLPCKKGDCIVPLDFDASLTICETCRCFLHRGCVRVTMVGRTLHCLTCMMKAGRRMY